MRARPSEPGDLGLIVERSPGGARWGHLLRDETLHGLYSYLEDDPNDHRPDPVFHEMSHGEAFLEILASRATRPGVYLLDLVADGAQLVIATHSPVLAALPGATILEVGPWGLRPAAWEELELTASWRQFLGDPQSFLRHLT